MAQLYKVNLGADLPESHWHRDRHLYAAFTLAAGVGTAIGIMFAATGRMKEVYSFGIAAAVVGGVWGAAQVLNTSPEK